MAASVETVAFGFTKFPNATKRGRADDFPTLYPRSMLAGALLSPCFLFSGNLDQPFDRLPKFPPSSSSSANSSNNSSSQGFLLKGAATCNRRLCAQAAPGAEQGCFFVDGKERSGAGVFFHGCTALVVVGLCGDSVVPLSWYIIASPVWGALPRTPKTASPYCCRPKYCVVFHLDGGVSWLSLDLVSGSQRL